MLEVTPGTIAVYSDIGCPWAHAAVHRLHAARRELGLDGSLVIDHRAWALELVNRRPTPKRILDSEIPVAGSLAPDAGWQMWQGDLFNYPVTTLPALEAVQAAKDQGLATSERLDRALRRAMFGESRCISMRHVILDVAGECEGVDVDDLEKALDDGRGRRAVMAQHSNAEAAGVIGSPHLFLPDGTSVHHPGVEVTWVGEKGQGFPIIESDDPGAYRDLVARAARKAA